jgi:hypothetical protein
MNQGVIVLSSSEIQAAVNSADQLAFKGIFHTWQAQRPVQSHIQIPG